MKLRVGEFVFNDKFTQRMIDAAGKELEFREYTEEDGYKATYAGQFIVGTNIFQGRGIKTHP